MHIIDAQHDVKHNINVLYTAVHWYATISQCCPNMVLCSQITC